MIATLRLIELILFYMLSISAGYVLVFALASKLYRKRKYKQNETYNRFAVLFPAYKEDKVIVQSVISFLEQDYPKDKYDVIVISDQMEDVTNEALSKLPIRLLKATYTDSSKAKAMTLAMNETRNEAYDMVVIMDADNTTLPSFLEELNKACNKGLKAIQAHRTAKNQNTSIAMLDSLSEEINNSIFRKGHVAIGFSSALIGSGMAFNADWFREHVELLQTAGEDKELELLLLKQRIYIEYLDHVPVYDEKTSQKDNLQQQRRRWQAAQFVSLLSALPHFPKAFFTGNFDYCDKVLQWLMPSRIMLLAFIFAISSCVSLLSLHMAMKWWLLLAVLVFALALAVPGRMWNKKLLAALIKAPLFAFVMISNLFKLKGAGKRFIHTRHGEH